MFEQVSTGKNKTKTNKENKQINKIKHKKCICEMMLQFINLQ